MRSPKLFSFVVLIAAIAFAFVGCAGTSAPFQFAAFTNGPVLADTLTAYVTADTTLTPAVSAQRQADIASLRQATATQWAIDFQAVSDAWARLRDPYTQYLTNDVTLSDVSRGIRLQTGAKFDALIAAEKARKASLITPQS